jgi:hypothetical protein
MGPRRSEHRPVVLRFPLRHVGGSRVFRNELRELVWSATVIRGLEHGAAVPTKRQTHLFQSTAKV